MIWLLTEIINLSRVNFVNDLMSCAQMPDNSNVKMLKKYVAQYLTAKVYREFRGKKKTLADAMGKKLSYIVTLTTGKGDAIGPAMIHEIADFFHDDTFRQRALSLKYGKSDEPMTFGRLDDTLLQDTLQIAIQGAVVASGIEVMDLGPALLPRINVPREHRDGVGLYALEVRVGPLDLGVLPLPPGGYVVVRRIDEAFPESRLQDGDRVVLETPKGQFLKVLHRVDRQYVLSPLDDTENKDRILTAPGSREYQITGKVVAFLGYLP